MSEKLSFNLALESFVLHAITAIPLSDLRFRGKMKKRQIMAIKSA